MTEISVPVHSVVLVWPFVVPQHWTADDARILASIPFRVVCVCENGLVVLCTVALRKVAVATLSFAVRPSQVCSCSRKVDIFPRSLLFVAADFCDQVSVRLNVPVARVAVSEAVGPTPVWLDVTWQVPAWNGAILVDPNNAASVMLIALQHPISVLVAKCKVDFFVWTKLNASSVVPLRATAPAV